MTIEETYQADGITETPRRWSRTRRRVIAFLVGALCLSGAGFAAAVLPSDCQATWDGPASGNWDTATNWDTNVVPAVGSRVCIPDMPGSLTITYSSNDRTYQWVYAEERISVTGGTLRFGSSASHVSDVTEIQLAGGSIGGAGELRVSDVMTWTSGDQNDGGKTTIAEDAVLTLNGFPRMHGSRVIENNGTIDVPGDFDFASGSSSPSQGMITNNGSIVKSAGTDVTHFCGYYCVKLTNNGELIAETGKLQVDSENDPAWTDPVLTADDGASIELRSNRILSGTTTANGTVKLMSGDMTVNGTLSVPEGSTFTFDSGNLFGTHDLQGPGTINWRASYFHGGQTTIPEGTTLRLTGEPRMSGGHVITNNGTIDVPGDYDFASASPVGPSQGVIENNATIVKSAGGDVTHFCGYYCVKLANEGELLAETGTLQLNSEADPAWTDPVLTAEDGASIELRGHRTLSGTTTANGIVKLMSHDLTVDGTLSVPEGSTFTFDSGSLLGTHNLEGPGTINWRATTFRTGQTTIPAGTTLRLTGEPRFSEGHVLTNDGTLDVPGDHDFGSWAPVGASQGVIENNATIVKSAGTDVTHFCSYYCVKLVNAGELIAETGTLQANSEADPAWTDAVLTAEDGALIELRGHRTLSGTTTANGDVKLMSHDLTVSGTLSSPEGSTFGFNGGTLRGTHTLQGPGTFNWPSTTFVAGHTTISDGTTLRLTAEPRFSEGHVLTNNGTLDVPGDHDFGTYSTATIQNNGTLVKSAGTDGTHFCSYYCVSITNPGTIRSDSGRLQMNTALPQLSGTTISGGTYVARNGGRLDLPGNADVRTTNGRFVIDGSSSTIQNESNQNALRNLATIGATGGLELDNGKSLTTPGPLANAGEVVIGDGSTLTSTGNYTQSTGSTELTDATSSLVATGGAVTINGGSLSGVGTVSPALTNGATVAPGNSPGVLKVSGPFTQTNAGTLAVEVDGDTVGSEFDQLDVTGAASLDGTLAATLGANAPERARLVVVDAGSLTGTFSSITGLTGEYSADYDATTAALRIGDWVAPGAPSLTPPSDPSNDTTPEWTFTGEDGVTFLCTLSKGATVISGPSECASPFAPTLASGDGTYTFSVLQRDASGNESDASSDDYALDTTAPSVTLTTPADGGSYVQGSSVVADYSCSPDATSCVGTVADGAPIDTSTLGSETFTVSVSDAAGNSGEVDATYNVVLDGVDLTVGDSPDVLYKVVKKNGKKLYYVRGIEIDNVGTQPLPKESKVVVSVYKSQADRDAGLAWGKATITKPIAAGGTLVVNAKVAKGTPPASVIVAVDTTSKITEASEANNERTLDLS
jgi:hypothetical protein